MDTKGPISPPSDKNQNVFVNIDASTFFIIKNNFTYPAIYFKLRIPNSSPSLD